MAFNYNSAIAISAEFTGQKAINEATKGLNSIKSEAGGLNSQLSNLVKGGLAQLAAAFTVGSIVGFTKGLIDLGDHLNDLRQKTGIGVDALSALKTAAELGGSSFEDLEVSLRKFSITVGNAESGSRVASIGFRNLGISLRDSQGNLKTTDQLLFDVSDKFKNMADGSAKATIATQLFGKAGINMIPVLNEGRESLQKFGLVVGQEFASRSDHFNDNLTLMKVKTQQLGISLLNDLLPSLNKVGDAFLGLKPEDKNSISLIGTTIEGIGALLIVVVQRAGAFIDIIKSGFSVLTDSFKQAAEQIWNFVKFMDKIGPLNPFKDFDKVKDNIKKFTTEASGDFKSFYDKQKLAGEDLSKKLSARFEDTGKAFRKIFSPEKLDAVKNKTGGTPVISNEEDAKRREREAQAIEKLVAEKKQLLAINEIERNKINLTNAEYQKLISAQKESGDATKESIGFLAENKIKYQEIAQEIANAKDALIDFNEQQKRTFSAGAKDALKDYTESARNVAAQTKQLFLNAFRGMEDALINFVRTGQLSFKALADAIMEDLLRIAIRQALVFGISAIFGGGSAASTGSAPVSAPSGAQFNGLGGGFQFANGGIMSASGSMPLHRYANGGIASSPQMALFGEGSRPEAFVPLPDGRSIPVKFDGGSNGGTSVVVNVNVAGDGSSNTDTKSASGNGKELGVLIAGAVRATLINEKRPGGLLA